MFCDNKRSSKESKEKQGCIIDRVKKNWIVEVSGKKFRIEELFENKKLCKRTVKMSFI